jgi:HEAT repeat protein
VSAIANDGIAQSLGEAVLLAVANVDRTARERAIDEAAEKADPKGLVQLISTEDIIRRNAALEALGKAGGRSVPALVSALEDPDPEIVMFAASTLGKTLDRAAVPHLERLLSHPDINVCQAAIESLGSLRATSALAALAGLLGRDVWLRFSVVHTLGEIADPRSVRTLIDLLGDDQVREVAISSLGKIGGVEAIEELVRRLEKTANAREFSLYVAALGAALAHLPDPSALYKQPFWMAFAGRAATTVAPRLSEILAAASESEDGAKIEAALDIVRCLRLRACFRVVVSSLATDERFTDQLLFTAADVGAPFVPYLAAGLSDRDPQVRRLSALAVAAAAFEHGGVQLTRLLDDPDEAARILVVRLLARLHHTHAIAKIVDRLDDPSSAVHAAAVEALCRMDAELVSAELLGKPHPSSERQVVVLGIMRQNPHPLQRAFLEASLRSARAEVREAAVAALAAQREADAAGTLAPMLADPSVAVRRAALRALADQRSERLRLTLLGLMGRDAEMRDDIVLALGRLGDDRWIARVIEVFDSFDLAQKTNAIDALGATESPSAEPFLAQKLGHREPEVRRAAVRALVRLGTTSALRCIRAALRDEDPQVRLAIAQALASCPHPIARGALEHLAVDPEESVAQAARAQLG